MFKFCSGEKVAKVWKLQEMRRNLKNYGSDLFSNFWNYDPEILEICGIMGANVVDVGSRYPPPLLRRGIVLMQHRFQIFKKPGVKFNDLFL